MSDDGFLSRWSRRKTQVARGEETPSEPAQPQSMPLERAQPPAAEQALPAAAPEREPPPTMDDVAALTPESDYSRFLAPQVDEPVKRAAMKKLFTDPHFNVMDGLDTYIDDYSKPDPIPRSMLRSMVQSQMLGLFDDEEEKKASAEPKASPDGAPAPAVPQSAIDPPAVPPDEDPDLRLQQDDAAGRGGPREGPPA